MAQDAVTNGRDMQIRLTGHTSKPLLFHFREAEIEETVTEHDATTDADGTSMDYQPGMMSTIIRCRGFLSDSALPEWPGVHCTWTLQPLASALPSMQWSGSGFLQTVTSSMAKTGDAGWDAVIRVKGEIDKVPTPTPSITLSPFDV